MPEEVIDEGNPDPGYRAFQPMLPPDHPEFDQAMKMDTFDIVRSRQFHHDKHLPVCFKYGSKKCRFRFPRQLIPETVFDDSTGVILQRLDREWLNYYNPWLSLVMRTNHDSQYLFSQTEALAKIYYTMKYITKTEGSTYSKLTIAAAVAKALTNSGRRDKGKAMVIRTYNKISSHREVGIPEAISHLLDLPDVLTGAIFENVHTTHLLNHLKSLNGRADEIPAPGLGEASIVRVHNKTTLISLFDDYAHRGSGLADMCLYDYCSLVYKSPISKFHSRIGGLPFEPPHPQHTNFDNSFERRPQSYQYYWESYSSCAQIPTMNSFAPITFASSAASSCLGVTVNLLGNYRTCRGRHFSRLKSYSFPPVF
jgi:hypothetical protein